MSAAVLLPTNTSIAGAGILQGCGCHNAMLAVTQAPDHMIMIQPAAHWPALPDRQTFQGLLWPRAPHEGQPALPGP